ncbi:nucleic acid-binding, OB-fold protein [Tanacetum coccineum]
MRCTVIQCRAPTLSLGLPLWAKYGPFQLAHYRLRPPSACSSSVHSRIKGWVEGDMLLFARSSIVKDSLMCKLNAGGYGTATLEELLQVITWAQLGIHDKPAKYLINARAPSSFLVFTRIKGMHEFSLTVRCGWKEFTSQSDGDKGKMIMVESEITPITDLRPTDCNKTIKPVVHRKWTSRHVYTRQPTKYCCILMDKQGTPIQENMNAKDADIQNNTPLHKL